MAEVTKTIFKEEEKVKRDTNWPSVLFQIYIHASISYGVYFCLHAKIVTIVFGLLLIALGILGTTAGAHRLWAHRSYNAHPILKIFLMLCQTSGGTGPIYDWVLDHRIHHQFHGTDNDPFNYKKGFIYAHVGNRILVENPKKQELLKEIDTSDLENDKILMFQKRFYWVLMPIIALLLPINTPVEYWGENMLYSIMVTAFFRLGIMFHVTWLVNSARSVWGLEPKDRFFTDSNLVFLIKKSHWHKYHYSVPWDCFTGEFGSYNCGCTTGFIKICAILGLASNLKTVTPLQMTKALVRHVDTEKPIEECILNTQDELLSYQYEDATLGIIDSAPY